MSSLAMFCFVLLTVSSNSGRHLGPRQPCALDEFPWCCSITSPQRGTSSLSASLIAESDRLSYVEKHQSAAERPAPRRQLSHQSSSGPLNLPSASWDDSGDPGHIFSLSKPEDADKSLRCDLPEETPEWGRASHHPSKTSLSGNEAILGFESTAGNFPRSRAFGLDAAPRRSVTSATELTSDRQTLGGAARQNEADSVSASASRSSDWHPLMADSRQNRSASDEQHGYNRQSGPSQHGHASRQSSKMSGLSDPEALGLRPSQGAASVQQPVHASSSVGRHGLHSAAGTAQQGQFELASSSASHAVNGCQGRFPKTKEATPAESTLRRESAAESAAGPEQVESESTEAMLQRIHRSLRKPISQPRPGLHTHSLDIGHAPRLESGSKQDSGMWWPHHYSHTTSLPATLLHRHCRDRQCCPPTHLQHVFDLTEDFRVNRAGAGARVGGPGVRGAGVEGARAPQLGSDAAALDDVKGSPSAHALTKSSGTKGMHFHCETLSLLHFCAAL